MSTPRGLELERDAALDDDMALDRALRIVKILHLTYGKDPQAAKYIGELADRLIGVKRRARARHQAIERRRIAERDDAEMQAQLL